MEILNNNKLEELIDDNTSEDDVFNYIITAEKIELMDCQKLIDILKFHTFAPNFVNLAGVLEETMAVIKGTIYRNTLFNITNIIDIEASNKLIANDKSLDDIEVDSHVPSIDYVICMYLEFSDNINMTTIRRLYENMKHSNIGIVSSDIKMAVKSNRMIEDLLSESDIYEITDIMNWEWSN